uniref:Sulfotransferase family protein n=1 Tax=Candidatus Kentrum eta TaxID=2126337 RepID=A0A450V2C3_9GAMM|nr:MAG: Sulfotransferase family protein [Candidatus Kentron sp. H]VFJ92343.1 MAG: Sulfotransferase family protein [Candidatus Kentron sp. H]VFJ98933.1 MAG: Sulfotransferase family protein [Candidatus Kentron sp. H]
MLISYTNKFIFIHVAKVAGLSMKKALEDYVQEPEKFRVKRPPKVLDGKPNPLYEMWDAFLTHVTAKDVRKELPKEIYNSFYKFAFVRNPWDWQVSMYHFILKETTHVSHELVKSMGGFDEYLAWIINTKKKNFYPKGATKFQKEMLIDQDGKIIVDFVGKYENLEEDFQHVCRIINIQASLPSVNRTVHKDYRSYYNDKTKKMVLEHFKEDIELFGYTFDG